MTTTDTLDAATEYTSKRGWRLVPVKRGTKRPPMNGWQDLRLDTGDLPKHFANGANIGVLNGEPSGGLVDVDLDSTEAVALAKFFLSKTACRHGRTSRPESHSWYTCDPLPDTTKFQDPKKPEAEGMIVELRSTGTQTVLPPSIHPDKESYEWNAEGRPTIIDGRILLSDVSRLAAAALLVRYWPSSGSRQDTALALAGGLLRAGWEEEGVAHFIEAVATVAGDEEVSMRAGAGKASAKRLAADRPATGWPKLAEFVGDTVADKVAEWLGIRWETESIPPTFGSQVADKQDWPADAAPEAFYGLAGDMARTLAPHTEADPHAILVSTLVAFGNAAGDGPHFWVERDRHTARLFAVLVGDTSKARKGMSWSHVQSCLAVADELWTKNNTTSGLSSGEGLIWAVRDAICKQDPVKKKGLVVEYQQVEVDAGVADKRLLVLESEFARTLKVIGREGNTLSTIVRQAWDSGDLRVMTKNSPARATGAHISILGHVTKEELERELDGSEAANGFGNRFLWMMVKRSNVLPEGGSPPEAEMVEIGEGMAEALAFAQSVGEMKRDAAARDIWHEVYSTLSAGKPGLFGAMTARAEAQVMRLALVYALLDISNAIKEPHLRAGLALWERCEASVRYVFGDLTGDPIADTILRALRTQGPMPLAAINRLFSSHAASERVARALNTLLDAGLVLCEQVTTGGRPATVWKAK